MEEEHIPISSHGTRYRHDVHITGGVGQSRRRGSTPIRARRGRGSENGRASGGLSHTPPLTRGTVPGPQNVRRAAGSFAQSGILNGSTARSQQGYRMPLASDGAHRRVRSSPWLPPDTAPSSRDSNSSRMLPGTAPSSRDSNSGSQGAHRRTSSFVWRGLLGGGTPARSQQGTGRPSPVDMLIVGQGTLHPCRRERHRGLGTQVMGLKILDVQRATPSGRGSRRGPRLDGVSMGARRFSPEVVLRAGQGVLPLYRLTQHRPPGT